MKKLNDVYLTTEQFKKRLKQLFNYSTRTN